MKINRNPLSPLRLQVTMLNVGSMHYDLPWLLQVLWTEELARRRLLLDSEQDQMFDSVLEQVREAQGAGGLFFGS